MGHFQQVTRQFGEKEKECESEPEFYMTQIRGGAYSDIYICKCADWLTNVIQFLGKISERDVPQS